MLTVRHIPRLLAAALLGATLSLAAPASAQTGGSVADPVIRTLTEEGYTVTDVSRTWLGRILITARNARYLREVALDRRTGAILGDQRFMRTETGAPPAGAPAGKGSSGGTGGSSGEGGGNGGGAGGGGEGSGG